MTIYDMDYWKDQAVKPRGFTIKERFKYIIDWWDKTSNIQTKDLHQKEYLELGRSIANQYKDWFQINDEQDLIAKIKGAINVHQHCFDSKPKHFQLHAYYYIELNRVLEILDGR